MRYLLKFLKYTTLTLLTLLVFVVGGLAFVWWKPALLLNETMAKKAMRYAPPELKVSWKTFQWDFQNTGLLSKRTNLVLGDLCVQYGKEMRGCFPKFHVDVSFGFHHGVIPEITRVDDFEVNADSIEIVSSDAPEKQKKSPTGPLPDLRLPSFLTYYPSAVTAKTLGSVELRLKEFRLIPKEGPELKAEARFLKESTPDSEAIRFRLDAKVQKGPGLAIELGGNGTIPPEEKKVFQFTGAMKGIISGWKMVSPLLLSWGENVDLKAEPDLRQKKDRYSTPLVLHAETDLMKLTTGALPLTEPMKDRKLGLQHCEIEAHLKARRGYPDKTNLSCTFALKATRQTRILPSVESTVVGELNLDPVDNRLVKANFQLKESGNRPLLPSHIEASFDGQLNLANGSIEGTPKLDFAGTIGTDNIADWIPVLVGTPYAIPAPMNALSGPISLEMKLDKVDGRKELDATAFLKTNLSGGSQSFVSESTAKIRFADFLDKTRALFADANVKLSNIEVVAPPMKLGLPPNGIPDSRFLTQAQLTAKREAKKAARLHPGMPIHWTVNLVNEQPMRLSTNLLPNPVPVGVNLKLSSDGPMVGFVEVLPMGLKIFSKQAEVRSIKLSFNANSKVPQLNGVIVNKVPGVEIRILLLGSTEAPNVQFESDPPLDRDQIISMLLFNKTLADVQKQQLTDSEAATTTSTSQAMSDGALGLFSLFFLSSTPIQSVGYDPASGTYTIAFKLGDKTTLGVGSNFGGTKNVSLRRSLGGPWAVSSELTQAQDQPNVVLTMLEWFRRF